MKTLSWKICLSWRPMAELTADGALVHGPFTALETLQDGLRSGAGACRSGGISGIR